MSVILITGPQLPAGGEGMKFICNSDLVMRAHDFAKREHADHIRKGSKREPHIVHCERVANLVIDAGGHDDQIAAALLHDIRKVGLYSLVRIGNTFGPRIEDIVRSMHPRLPNREYSYIDEKNELAKLLRQVDVETRLVKAAEIIEDLVAVRNDPPTKWNRERCLEHTLGRVILYEAVQGASDYLDDYYEGIVTATWNYYSRIPHTALAS